MKTLITITALFTLLSFYGTGQIINVPGDQPTIQAGIDAATNGDTVLVNDGTYLENINFLGKAITVTSHFLMDGDTNHINNTIIDGSQPVNPDYGSTVSFTTGEDTTSVLYGFTVTGGSGMNVPVYNMVLGGGIVCFYSGARIAHNKIIYNEISDLVEVAGGGICSFSDNSEHWIIIENNNIEENKCYTEEYLAFGGGICVTSNAMIRQNNINNNICTSKYYNAEGGGIAAINMYGEPDQIYIINNTLSSNYAGAYNIVRGGGIVCKLSHAIIQQNIIIHNTISGNKPRGGGISIVQGVSTSITENLIDSNSIIANAPDLAYWGPGACCGLPTGPTIVQNNEVSNNTGPEDGIGVGGGLAITTAYEKEIIVDANKFLNNTAQNGGGFYERNSYNVLLTNNIFSGNTSIGHCGGLRLYHTETQTQFSANRNGFRPQIINNTFCSNSAENEGGAIRSDCAIYPPVIFNCIFWDNEAENGNDVVNASDVPINISYSDIDPDEIVGLWEGEGNINEDPEFEPDDPLCHLSEFSPCIGAGIESLEVDGIWYDCPPMDYEGEPRPGPDGNVDIGADELFFPGIGPSKFQVSNFNLQISPNPCSGKALLRYQIPDTRYLISDLYSISGMKISRFLNAEKKAGNHEFEIDVSDLPDGIYYVRLMDGKSIETIKLMVFYDY